MRERGRNEKGGGGRKHGETRGEKRRGIIVRKEGKR